MIEARRPICQKHKNIAKYLCFYQQCERVCEHCFNQPTEKCTAHRKNVMSEEEVSKFVKTNSKEQIELANKALARHRDLTMIARQAKQVYSNEENNILKLLTSGLQKQKLAIREKQSRVKSIRNQLNTIQKSISYFKQLKQTDLIDLKVKLSNEKGLAIFKKKCQKFAELSRKSTIDQIKQIYEKQTFEEKQIDTILANGLMAKTKKILGMKCTQKTGNGQNLLGGFQEEDKENSANKGSSKSIKVKRINRPTTQQSIESVPSKNMIPQQSF